MENLCKIETRFYISSKIISMKNQVFGKGCMYANHMNPAVEYVSGRVRPKMRKSKIRENILKKRQKNSRTCDAKNLKKHEK